MKPNIWRFDNVNSLYYALVDAMATAINQVNDRSAVVALPTGNTMIPFYRIATDATDLKIKTENLVCFNLDEYYPLSPESQEFSFNEYMKQNFYSRLKTAPRVTEILNGTAPDKDAECLRYENEIKKHGGLDLALLGIGQNGHIAFNEPGSSIESRTRAVELHPQTLMANFKGKAPFTHALTMGIGTLLEARQILVVAVGKNKAKAVKSAIEEPCSITVPASALQNHSNVTWFLDPEAASLI